MAAVALDSAPRVTTLREGPIETLTAQETRVDAAAQNVFTGELTATRLFNYQMRNIKTLETCMQDILEANSGRRGQMGQLRAEKTAVRNLKLPVDVAKNKEATDLFERLQSLGIVVPTKAKLEQRDLDALIESIDNKITEHAEVNEEAMFRFKLFENKKGSIWQMLIEFAENEKKLAERLARG